MRLTVFPNGPLQGTYTLHGDKSLSHRAALFAALATGESEIQNFLVAGVTHAMLRGLTALGVSWTLDGTTLTVDGTGFGAWEAPPGPVDCGHSGTTLRLLAGAVAAAGVPATLDGSKGLRRRPMDRIVRPLQMMDVPIVAQEGGHAPLVLEARAPGRALKSIRFEMPVASAQVKSCVLLAGLAADGPTVVVEPGPSRDHTERLLASQGVEIETSPMGEPAYPREIRMQPPRQALSPLILTLPGDFSAAAFLIVAAAITPGSSITLQGVGLNPTRTGLLDALRAMGASLDVERETVRHGEPVGDLTVRAAPLRGVEIAGDLVVRMIDEFPAFAVAAAFAQGPTVVREATELRYKESDRIQALCAGLSGLGVPVRELPDGFELPGGAPPEGGRVDPRRDHRLAMALALAGLAGDGPVTVAGAEIIDQSFPGFVGALLGLGADVRLEPKPTES